MRSNYDPLVRAIALELGRGAGIDYYIVDCVLARYHTNEEDGSEVVVVNFYPKWRGDYGQGACGTFYLDNEYNIKKFEEFAGIKVEELNVLSVTQPIMRKPGQEYDWENVTNTFGLLMAPQEEGGVKKKKRRILHWEKLPYGSRAENLARRSSKTDPSAPASPVASQAQTVPTNGQPKGGDNAGPGEVPAGLALVVSKYLKGDRLAINTTDAALWVFNDIWGYDNYLPDLNKLYVAGLAAYDAKYHVSIGNGMSKKEAMAAARDDVFVLIAARNK